MNKLIEHYKNLHRIPEEGFKEFKTQSYILEQLKNINCKIFTIEPTGLLAFFDYGFTECIAFRCEMDGLPILEKNDFDYISNHEGWMHACGHDGHMAIMLSFAKVLENIKCPRNVCLIFQPSEETYGGALKIINSTEFKHMNIVEVYGLHLWPNLKKGVIASRGNSLMASSTEVDIHIIGKSVHIANKEKGIDAIAAARHLLNKIEAEENVIFNCGKISTSGARNVLCDNVLLECSLRTLYKIKRKNFLKNLNEKARLISNELKANIYVVSNRYIPEVRNSVILFEKYRHLIDEVIAPVYQAEDFSFYNEYSKSLFLFLGVGNTSNLHSNDFKFDTEILEKGVKIFTAIATSH